MIYLYNAFPVKSFCKASKQKGLAKQSSAYCSRRWLQVTSFLVPGGGYKQHLSHLPKAQRYFKMILIFINLKTFKSDY